MLEVAPKARARPARRCALRSGAPRPPARRHRAARSSSGPRRPGSCRRLCRRRSASRGMPAAPVLVRRPGSSSFGTTAVCIIRTTAPGALFPSNSATWAVSVVQWATVRLPRASSSARDQTTSPTGVGRLPAKAGRLCSPSRTGGRGRRPLDSVVRRVPAVASMLDAGGIEQGGVGLCFRRPLRACFSGLRRRSRAIRR